jgi:hypothetical protein
MQQEQLLKEVKDELREIKEQSVESDYDIVGEEVVSQEQQREQQDKSQK